MLGRCCDMRPVPVQTRRRLRRAASSRLRRPLVVWCCPLAAWAALTGRTGAPPWDVAAPALSLHTLECHGGGARKDGTLSVSKASNALCCSPASPRALPLPLQTKSVRRLTLRLRSTWPRLARWCRGTPSTSRCTRPTYPTSRWSTCQVRARSDAWGRGGERARPAATTGVLCGWLWPPPRLGRGLKLGAGGGGALMAWGAS